MVKISNLKSSLSTKGAKTRNVRVTGGLKQAKARVNIPSLRPVKKGK
jgi:hypothetical protein